MDRVLENAKFCELAYMKKEDIADPEMFKLQHGVLSFELLDTGIAQCWVFQKHDTLIFAFAGTDSLYDMYLDTQTRLVHVNHTMPELGMVHWGFNRYATSLKEMIYMVIEDFLVLTPGEKLDMSAMSQYQVKTLNCDDISDTVNSTTRESPGNRNSSTSPINSPLYPVRRSLCRTRSNATNGQSSMEYITDIRLTSTCMIQVHRVNPNASPHINNIIFTGHSLGGCCAIVALHVALDFRKLARIKCYTYGSPMIGDKLFAKNLCEYVPYNFNVIHKYDLIPSTPCFRYYSKQHGIIVIDNDSTFMITHRWWYMFLMFVFGWSCCCNRTMRYTGAALKGEAHKIATYIKVLEKIYTERKSQKDEYIARIYPIFSGVRSANNSNAANPGHCRKPNKSGDNSKISEGRRSRE
jgi:hypothetical protein